MQTGAVTAGTEYITIGNGGWRLRGEMTAEDKKKVVPGTQAEVEFSSGGKTEVTIEAVAVSEENAEEGEKKEETYIWYAALPEETETEKADTFTWKAETESEKEYEQMIPVPALREDINGAYCLILTETEQMLGTVQTAKRVPVTVLEKDGKNAAIMSELKKSDQIIVSSEKYVSGGDRVRIKE